MASNSPSISSPHTSPLVVQACEDILQKAMAALDNSEGIEIRRLKRLQRAQEPSFRAACPAQAMQLLVESEEDNHKLQNLVSELYRILRKQEIGGTRSQVQTDGELKRLREEYSLEKQHNEKMQTELAELKQLVFDLKAELCLTQSKAWELEAPRDARDSQGVAETLDDAVALLESPLMRMVFSAGNMLRSQHMPSGEQLEVAVESNQELQRQLSDAHVEIERLSALCNTQARQLQSQTAALQSQNEALRSEVAGLKKQVRIVKDAAQRDLDAMQAQIKSLAADLLQSKLEANEVKEKALQVQQKASQVIRQFYMMQQLGHDPLPQRRSPQRSLPDERDAMYQLIKTRSPQGK